MTCFTRAAVCFLFPFLVSAHAEVRHLWQIGEWNQSPVEFSSKAERNAVDYRVGKSDWKQDWPRTQSVKQPYRISFPLDSVAGTYSLKIGALIKYPRVPALQVEVNGHSGIFYLHPQLSYSRSDFSFAFDPHESQSTITAEIPASVLKAGENTITITCVDHTVSPGDQDKFSGIGYDALSLDQDTSGEQTPNITADAVPTIFYKHQANGLVEIVDAFIRSNSPLKPGTAELLINGTHYKQALKGGHNFGEERISFEIPEWSGTANGTLSVSAGQDRSFPVSLAAQRKWTIFVVPHTHLDVGFTDYQGKVAETQARVLSQAADLIHEHPDFRFSMDGSWNLQQLLLTRPEQKRNEILGLIRTGKMAMPAQYANLLTGYASLETLYRSLYYSKKLSGEYKLPFEYANITDVPTYTGSYPSVLASSGVKYWVAAANNDRAPIFNYRHWNEKSPFWWQGPDGKKVLFWYSRHYEQIETLFGLPPELDAVRESLPIYLQAYSKPDYKPDVALLYGAQVENTDLYPQIATFATEWNDSYAYPKLNYATFPDFFHYVDEHYGKDLPTYKGDGGPYWEDGIGSDAYFAAEDRHNQHRALSAEVLSTVAHTIDANYNPPVGLFTDIWRNIVLFSEHTWLSYNAVSQPEHDESIKQLRVKDDRAERASIEIEDVMNRSLSQLADRIHVPAGTLVVFNSLNWSRDAIVETDLPEHSVLVDISTQAKVPLAILSNKDGFLHVRFLAKNLPAVGYKCFSVSKAQNGSPAQPTIANDETIENQFYRIKIDAGTGALASIYDKQLQRELVDSASPYKFGQYLYVTGGDGDTQMINPFPALAPGVLTVHPAEHGKYLGVEKTPWGQSIRLTSSSVNTPQVETEILLFNDQKRMEFRYHINKQYTTNKEGVYIAFPVAVSQPEFTYATQQDWINPARDLMKGASLEWFNIQGWMAAHDSNAAVGIVPVDAPLASFGDINRGKWPGVFQPKTGTMFSYLMNNYWHTNYRAGQGGEFNFRYAMTSSSKLDGDALSHLGAEEMRPAEVDQVVAQDKAGNPPRPLPAEGRGFLQIDNPHVLLATWKRAEDHHGTILRLTETAGQSEAATVLFPHAEIASARLTSGVEEDQSSLAVQNNSFRLSLKPFEVVTVRVTGKE
ncbi:MAG TPA: polysaccharide lyase family protein [Bryobacteraceae bacterium]|nr:polysaccharide lyase family protein [Bryobacteraceae bacterium]